MILANQPTATAAGDAAPTTSIPATQAVETPFDQILSLETLAAVPPVDPALLADAGLAAPGEDSSVDDETEIDEEEGIEPAGSLAFLFLELAAVTPRAQPTAQGDGPDPAVGDVLGGGHGKHVGTGEPAFSIQQAARNADSAGVAIDPTLAPAAATVEFVDAAQAVDAASGVARSAEWTAHGTRHAAAAGRDGIMTPARDPRWAEEFSARVSLMVRGGESSASLQMSPAELGPLDVSVTVRDSQATIHFGAAQAETRALIEASIPRLREMLAAQGFHLMDASVSQGFSRQAQPGAQGQQRSVDQDGEVQSPTRVTVNGLLDLYA